VLPLVLVIAPPASAAVATPGDISLNFLNSAGWGASANAVTGMVGDTLTITENGKTDCWGAILNGTVTGSEVLGRSGVETFTLVKAGTVTV
jgi:hypothetical protein